MRLLEHTKTLMALFRDYRSMNKDDRSDFYQSKCYYYHTYVALCMVVGALASMMFIFTDYLYNGSILPTLLPRLSVLIFLVPFILITHFNNGRGLVVFMDFFLAHGIVIATILTTACLKDNVHAGEFFIVMGFLWMIVGFVGKPQEILASMLVFYLEIFISNAFIHYPSLEAILPLTTLCCITVILSHLLLTLYYLDHYRIRQKLELAMVTDPLTQVYNRHLLEKIVAKNALKNVKADEPIAVAMLDIDYFKKINDDNGHYTGDLTLLYVGQKLSKETHSDDYVIRYGGEEFVIILRNCDVNNACARMEQFRRDIENAKDAPVPFTVSVGVSRYTGDYSRTLQNVDTALYKAKNTGRNKVVVV